MRPREISGLPLCQAVFLTLIGFFAWAGTIFVPADHPTIQEAIETAMDGDVIQVAPGTYIENIDFLGKAITVMSTGGPDVTTIESGPGGSVVTFAAGEGPGSVLDGFTVTGGSGTWYYPGDVYRGGGILCIGTSPVIINNTISGNGASAGGGICLESGSAATIMNNTISGNSASWGGGICADAVSAPSIVGNTIASNACSSDAYYYPPCLFPGFPRGGGILATGAHIESNLVQGNTVSGAVWANARGGGILAFDSTLVNNTVATNSVEVNGETCYTYYSCGTFFCSSSRGGGLFVENSIVVNTTVYGNAVSATGVIDTAEGGGIYADSSIVANSICWGNSALEDPEIAGSAMVSYSNVQGGHPGVGNIDTAPLFVNPAEGDFHLLRCSPAIDAGDNTLGSLPATDFEGDPRIVNGVVDMGADEVADGPGPCPPIFVRGDCNDDGGFDIGDAVFLLNELFSGGDPAPCDDACDMNDDGLKDIGDAVYGLNALFAGGPAPTPPNPSCGSDPTADSLDCASYTGCP